MTVTPAESSLFRQAAHTLRRYRKADIVDEGTNENLIDDLYVDLFRDNHLIEEFKRDNTAFLIGRRGTGKSTLFEKAQHDFQKNPKVLCAYIDVQPVFQVANADYAVHEYDGARAFSERLRWSHSFLKHLTASLVEDIAKKAVRKWSLQDPLSFTKRRQEETQRDIESLFTREEYLAEANISPYGDKVEEKTRRETQAARIKGKASAAGPEIEAGLDAEEELETKFRGGQNIVRTFDFNRFATALKKAVNGMGIKRVVIFVDDYSELELSAQKVLMDNVIHPLETASGEFVKFKIAAYPGKYYTGKLDAQKIDMFHLDISAAYSMADEVSLEREATDYVKRLLSKRIEFFCKKQVSYFFEGDETIFKTLFHASFCNPRALGHILDNCAVAQLSRGRRISAPAIKDAAQKYYDEKIEPELTKGRFTKLDPDTSAELESCKLLIKRIVDKARGLKNNRSGRVLKNIKDAQLPTSHFHTREECDDILQPLLHLQVLNFYQALKNKDAEKINVYALNYGLCSREDIRYGKPQTSDNQGKYYQERCFNYSDIVRDAQNTVEFFECAACKSTFDVANEGMYEVYSFACPSCGAPKALKKRSMLSATDRLEIEDVTSLLDPLEFEFLRALFLAERANLRAKEIAEEIDVSSALAGKVGTRLAEKGLVSRAGGKGARLYSLTPKAQSRFFETGSAVG